MVLFNDQPAKIKQAGIFLNKTNFYVSNVSFGH